MNPCFYHNRIEATEEASQQRFSFFDLSSLYNSFLFGPQLSYRVGTTDSLNIMNSVLLNHRIFRASTRLVKGSVALVKRKPLMLTSRTPRVSVSNITRSQMQYRTLFGIFSKHEVPIAKMTNPPEQVYMEDLPELFDKDSTIAPDPTHDFEYGFHRIYNGIGMNFNFGLIY